MILRPLVALDLGATKVACAIGLPHEHSPGFELLGTGIAAYPMASEGWPSDPLMIGRTIEQAMEATGLTGDFNHACVAVSCPSLRSDHVPVAITLADEPIGVRARDLERLRTAALNQALGVDREALVIERLGCSGNGFEGVRDPRGLPATHLRATFHLISMPLTVRRTVVQAVESAGLEVAQLTHSLSAVLASLTDQPLARRRALVIDVGGVTTDLGVFIEGVWQRAAFLPWGGLTCATAIATELRVTMEQALTWSVEGTACRRQEVRALYERQWAQVKEALDGLLADQPLPDAVLVGGRGGLIDGFVEWVERVTSIPTVLDRSPRTTMMHDLSRQLALSPSIGLLETATQHSNGAPVRSSRLLNRLIDQTRTLLTEYF